jgi:hypothetical protein
VAVIGNENNEILNKCTTESRMKEILSKHHPIKKKTPGLSPPANYTDQVTAACW